MTALLFQVKLQYKSVYREEIQLAWGGGGRYLLHANMGGRGGSCLPFVLTRSVPPLFWPVLNSQHHPFEVWAATMALIINRSPR